MLFVFVTFVVLFLGGLGVAKRQRSAEEELAEARENGKKFGGDIKKHQATRMRRPHPYTAWKGKPRDTVLFGRTLDDLGYYNNRNIEKYLGPEYKRICVLGPSIVMDLDHEEKDTICGFVQRELLSRGCENSFVYNCGIHASCTGQDLANLVHCVTDFYPDVIVTLGGGTDMRSAISGDPRIGYPQSFFMWEEILTSFRLEGLPPNVQASLENFEFSLPKLREEFGFGTFKWFSAICDHYKQNILKMRAVSKGFDFGCLVANPPTQASHRLNKAAEQNLKQRPLEYFALALAEFFDDVLPSFHEREVFWSSNLYDLVNDVDKSIFSDANHMTPVGYERIGKRIVDDLISQFPERLGLVGMSPPA